MNRRKFLRMGASALAASVARPIVGPLFTLTPNPIQAIDQVFIDARPLTIEEICAIFQVPVRLVVAR